MTGSRRIALLIATLALVALTSRGWWALLAVPVVWFAVARSGREGVPEAGTPPIEPTPSRAEPTDQLQGVLSAVRDGVLAVDANGRLLFANDAATNLLALPAAALKGRPLTEVIDWPQLALAVGSVQQSGSPMTLEAQFGDGEAARYLSLQIERLIGRSGVIVVVQDQSRVRRLESYRRDFVANVSHELKTPLAAIKGFVETMLEGDGLDPTTQQRFLGRIARQTERLSSLVSDLLVLSRLDSEASHALPVEPCDFARVVRETVRDLQPMADRKLLEVQTALPERPVPVRMEPETLRQVVGNLVDNAIKYTGERGRVAVRLRADRDEAHLEVEDSGIGLTVQDQERVFERFYRVDRARSRELGGTGLGLSIVKNSVLNHGGRVGVRSELGRGSTFWVVLGLAAGNGEP